MCLSNDCWVQPVETLTPLTLQPLNESKFTKRMESEKKKKHWRKQLMLGQDPDSCVVKDGPASACFRTKRSCGAEKAEVSGWNKLLMTFIWHANMSCMQNLTLGIKCEAVSFISWWLSQSTVWSVWWCLQMSYFIQQTDIQSTRDVWHFCLCPGLDGTLQLK